MMEQIVCLYRPFTLYIMPRLCSPLTKTRSLGLYAEMIYHPLLLSSILSFLLWFPSFNFTHKSSSTAALTHRDGAALCLTITKTHPPT